MSAAPFKTEPVAIGLWYAHTPSFHRIKDYTDYDAPITKCGRTLYQSSPILRYDHAAKIGKPCSQCFGRPVSEGSMGAGSEATKEAP